MVRRARRRGSGTTTDTRIERTDRGLGTTVHQERGPVPLGREHYFELASEPKQIAWYDNCNHELGAQARIDRALWLCEQLGLPCPSHHILDLLERVPPPVPIGY
jgi:hypothetical protein